MPNGCKNFQDPFSRPPKETPPYRPKRFVTIRHNKNQETEPDHGTGHDMARIIDITPPSRDIQPVLMILTSHRLDCFLLCAKCLEMYTDLSRFKKIYVLANEVDDEHAMLIKAFQQRHSNVIDIHITPRGLVPAVVSMQNFIMARHREDVIIRLDEDIFVTPNWLDHLMATYKIHRHHDQATVVTGLSPISRTGRQCMERLFRTHYPNERHKLPDLPVERNPIYHRFVWEKILHDDLTGKYFQMERPRHFYLGHITERCLLWDSRLMNVLLPMSPKSVQGVTRLDEFLINAALRRNGFKAVVNTSALVHHFSNASAEEYLRSHVSLDDVWWYLTGLEHSEAYRRPVTLMPLRTPPGGPGGRLPHGRTRSRELRVLT